MNIPAFDTLDELWLAASKYLITNGHQTTSRAGVTREVLGFAARLNDPTANFMFNPVRRMSPNYAAAELIWYLSGDDDIAALVPYAPQYERFANDGIAFGAYGKRWMGKTDPTFQHERKETENGHKNQWETLLTLLQLKGDTRQAILSCWNAGDLLHALVGDKNDLPCTLSLVFSVRYDKLYLSTYMRSNDLWLGTPYDIWSFTCLQMLIASHLHLGLGWYQHHAHSFHVYETDVDKAWQAANPQPFQTGPLFYQHNANTMDKLGRVVGLEVHNRRHRVVAKQTDDDVGGRYSLLAQTVFMAASKWEPVRAIDRIDNKLMANYMRWFYDCH